MRPTIDRRVIELDPGARRRLLALQPPLEPPARRWPAVLVIVAIMSALAYLAVITW